MMPMLKVLHPWIRMNMLVVCQSMEMKETLMNENKGVIASLVLLDSKDGIPK
jgi:hypothetical protein